MKDLVLTEAFHRQKRTLLLFSAALIVIGMAVPNATSTLKLAVIDATLSTTVARWLVWGGAFYYAVGLAMEVMVIRRLNSAAAVGAPSFEAMSEKLSTEVLNHYQAIAAFAERAPSTDFGVTSQLTEVLARLGSIPAPSALIVEILDTPELRFNSTKEADAVVKAVSSKVSQRFDGIEGSIIRLQGDIDVLKQRFDWQPLSEIVGKLDAVQYRLDRAHKDMTRITSSVVIERRAAFWGWEVGAAFAAFAVATIIGLPLAQTLDPVLAWLAPVLHRWPF